MQQLHYVILILLLGCNQKIKTQPQAENKKESKYKDFLSKFKDKSFDTLKVFSPEEQIGEYKGVELDSANAFLFPKNITQADFNNPPRLFAVYKFPIDNEHVGLIARTPSEYVASSIKFFLFDKAKDSIISYIELAENSGDAGDAIVKDSWLYWDKQKKLKGFILATESHDNNGDNPDGTTKKELNHYCLVDFSNHKSDTISKDGTKLKIIFKHALH